MPSRGQTIADAVAVFESADYPLGLTPTTAWLGIYQALLWYESVNWVGFTDLPHIIDADKLRPASAVHRQRWTRARAWQNRAQDFAVYLAQQLRCPPALLPVKTDLLMKHPSYEGMQRQNTLGIAFAGIIKHILERFGSNAVTYQAETEAARIFPGISVPGRSTTPRIDVLAVCDNIPRAIISTKWSVRHDRLNDITNECPVYKAAYERVYRQHRRGQSLLFYLLTNEFDPARLNKMLDDSCVDSVVHVHKAGVVDVCRLNGRLTNLLDLSELTQATFSWQR